MIAAIAIPISIVVTFFVMDRAGLTLNVISMAGLALAVGLLVDNSIVVLENIFRHKEQGLPIRQAAEDGTSQVSTAIVASTLTTLAVFIPILFVPGIAGIMFNDMAVTIVFSLSVSLFIALTLIPLLSSRFLGTGKVSPKRRLFKKMSNSVGGFLDSLERSYIRVLGYFLHHRKTLLIGVTVLFIGTMMLAPSIGGDFIGETDQSFIGLNVERESGAAITSTNETFLTIEGLINQEVPEAINTYINFGSGDIWNALFGNAGSNKGQVLISLPDIKDRDRDQFEIQDSLRVFFSKLPGARVTFQENNMGSFSAEGDIAVKIFGFDRLIAASIGDQIAEIMSSVSGVVDINKSYASPNPEYQIYLDRDRISAMGLSVSSVAQAVESSIKGTIATVYREGGHEIDVLVQLDEPYRQSMADIENIYVASPTGVQIPLANLAEIISGESATTIVREDQERIVTVSASVTGRDLRSTTKEVIQKLEQANLPPDFRWEIGGTAEEQAKSFMYLFIALISAVLLVYMVMASQFESLLNPFIIIFTIPLAFIGVIWMLFLTGTTLSITALIGGMLLIGIVVNNGIVLIDYINQLRVKHGYELWRAVIVGGRRRMRPVIMTALTTIFSMLPLALELGSGAEIWSPMARAIVGGLTASAFFTLALIPVIYFIMERLLLKRAMKKGKIKTVPVNMPADIDVLLVK
jgi:HAE1 family hydrophobic/amphiphilic exporter-1